MNRQNDRATEKHTNLPGVWGIFGAAALAMLLAGCGNSKSENAGDAENPEAQKSFQVTVEEMRLEPFTETLSLTGYVKSLEDVIISSEEGGVLKSWAVSRGASIHQGDLLASMDDQILRPQYEAARAQFEIADLTYQKQKKVYDEQGISEVQLKTTQYNRDAAKAQMELAQNRFERTRIKSPISGILDERYPEAGELVPPGSPVARVVNLDRMKVAVSIPENQAGDVKRGTGAEVSVSAYPGEVFAGPVSFVGSAVVSDNRTIPAEILLANPGRKLKPDMIARVKLRTTGDRRAILVDEKLVQQIDPKTSVVYVENNGTVEKRSIVIGGRNNGRVEVREGLSEGEHLIVSGADKVFEGQKVEVTGHAGDQPGDPR